ncbi:MAG: HAMP domain-containing protein [Bacteroidota bacterium]|nr:HAMP domain-containing protein [Bacteroidota bacterium]
MRTHFLYSIRTKFTGFSLLIVVPVLFFFMIYYPDQLSGIFEQALLERYQEQAKAASFGLAVGISTENYNLIGEGVAQVKKNKELLYIIILDTMNEVIALNNRTNQQPDMASLRNLPRIQVESSIVHMRQPIVFEGKSLGELFLGFSTNEIDVQLAEMRRLSYVIGSFCMILISLLIWIMTSKLTGPLVTIARAAVNFSKDEKYETIEVNTNDEIGDLTRSFNTMVKRLNDKKIALLESKRFSEDLLATIPSALLTIDDSFRVVSVNNSFCRLFQVLPDAVEGFFLQQILENRNFPHEIIQSILYGKEFYDVEIRIPAKDVPIGIHQDDMILQLSLTGIIRNSDLSDGSKTMLLILDDITSNKRAEEERIRLIQELQVSTIKVKTLSGLLPICASCKKIRDDKGSWNVLEQYIHDHSEAKFSHGLCPECAQRYFPDAASK